ncbi:MAG: hypothetical protein ORN54_11345 [Cyclobacteriaceae bacterium]|nr:hypothetical protein [Cyclobacteriaceae bacterium]
MVLKVFKAVWFLSLITFLGVFMYNYASMPEVITVIELETPFSLSRDALFYCVLAVAAISNLFVFVINKLFASQLDFRAWFYGLVISLNIFLIVGVNFVALYNSAEKFDYQAIGSIIYGSIALVVGWAVCWPLYPLAKRFFSK